MTFLRWGGILLLLQPATVGQGRLVHGGVSQTHRGYHRHGLHHGHRSHHRHGADNRDGADYGDGADHGHGADNGHGPHNGNGHWGVGDSGSMEHAALDEGHAGGDQEAGDEELEENIIIGNLICVFK